MTGSTVANRYARALLELALEQNQLEAWGEELTRLAQLISAPELAAQLVSPELADSARLQAVALIGEKLGLSFPLRSFGMVVARHRRLPDLPAIALSYQDLLDRHLGRVRAQLTFAIAPTPEQTSAVVAALEARSGKRVLATVKIDPNLLGGVMAEVEGRTYDASLATAMARLQSQLIS
ncbi:MAG TPA: ATP synthase F1 subunit delta [Candidatus Binataceae bacterium]|nr:ATP synthase F1 subunit delta [Candidatus Binataceae bacterium]